MDAYQTLRNRAIKKRDEALRKARDDYRRDMAALDALARSLYNNSPAPDVACEPAIGMLTRILPKDRPFTVLDLMTILEHENPDHGYRLPTLRTYMWRLADQGFVRKLYKSHDGYMLWIASDAEVADDQYANMPIADVAHKLLSECGPLPMTQIAVMLRERGYRPDADLPKLFRSVKNAMARAKGRFSQEGGRWDVADDTGKLLCGETISSASESSTSGPGSRPPARRRTT